jgi:hypothetical protein
LLVFTASDYIIGILAIALLFFTTSRYQWCNSDALKTNRTMAKIPIM